MINNNELTDIEIKLIAISSLFRFTIDEDMKRNLKTKRNTNITNIEKGYVYNCSFGFNGDQAFLKLLFNEPKDMPRPKNLFAMSNLKTGELQLAFLPATQKNDYQTAAYTCLNLDEITTYYTRFNYNDKEINDKTLALAMMIHDTIDIQKTR